MRILVVEDDDRLAAALQDALSQRGYDVTRAATAAAALQACNGGRRVDLVLLDLGLPDLGGAELAARLREVTAVPVIVVTARGDVTSRVDLLRSGADDYVVKPFAIAELLARITAVLRRTRAGESVEPIDIGDLRIDFDTRIVTVAGVAITLTRLEFDVLATLARARGAVVDRQRILIEVWDTEWHGMERSLEVHVGNLRSKLDRPRMIETVRGVGYRLAVARPLD